MACVVHADLKVEAGLKLKKIKDNYCHFFNFEIPVITVVARDKEGSRKQVFRARVCACVWVCVCVYACMAECCNGKF